MINIKIGIGFSIINMTVFEWHELQGLAQTIVDDEQFHTISRTFDLTSMRTVTLKDADLAAFVRRNDDSIEFLFIQKALDCFNLKEINDEPRG